MAHSYEKRKLPPRDHPEAASSSAYLDNTSSSIPPVFTPSLGNIGFFPTEKPKAIIPPPPPKMVQDDDMMFPLEI